MRWSEAVSALEATRRENELLRRKIDLLVRRVFGSSSEQLPANQLELLFAQAEPQAPQPEPVTPPGVLAKKRCGSSGTQRAHSGTSAGD